MRFLNNTIYTKGIFKSKSFVKSLEDLKSKGEIEDYHINHIGLIITKKIK